MPPKTQITKERIFNCAFEIVRSNGADALNARAIAKKLNCSTQPIFSNYSSMDELKAEIITKAKELYDQYLSDAMKSPDCPPYKSSGLGYISFAKEEKELFKLLFMRDRTGENIDERDEIDDLIKLISKSTGMSMEDAFTFHLEMWIYVHGIATMIATSYLDWDWEMISKMMTDAYEGIKTRFINRKDS